MGFNIAIDGPAGAGKSTIAKEVSKRLGFVYVDTGAMYRAIAYKCIKEEIDVNDESKVCETAELCQVTIKYVEGEQRVFLDNEDVSSKIRTQAVSEGASIVSQYKGVRDKLLSLQRKLAQNSDVVMDGRDIASTVLPDADVKIYLDASVGVRAKRRYEELILKGEEADLEKIEKEVSERDFRDMHRENSPLVRVKEAVYIDSSDMGIEEVVNEVIRVSKMET